MPVSRVQTRSGLNMQNGTCVVSSYFEYNSGIPESTFYSSWCALTFTMRIVNGHVQSLDAASLLFHTI